MPDGDPAPWRAPKRTERWIVLGAFLVALDLLIAMREMVADVLHEMARERDGRGALRIAPRESHLPQDLVHRFEAGAKP